MTNPDEGTGRTPSPFVRVPAVWAPAAVVATSAAVATAHGLYEVAMAAGVPRGIAWLYPVITDGLAIVAYGGTARLSGQGRRYAWGVVVLAAGLSGLAQAAYLGRGAGGEIAPSLRFIIGAWPAVATAVVAHLLFMHAAVEQPTPIAEQLTGDDVGVHRGENHDELRLPASARSIALNGDTSARDVGRVASNPAPECSPAQRSSPAAAPARARADHAASEYATRHGTWPTVSELEKTARVSRGTAAASLKALRTRPPTA